MKNIISILFILGSTHFANIHITAQTQNLNASEIMEKVDKNVSSENRITNSEMVINGRRNTRTIQSISYSVGSTKSMTEYLAPAREKGTKMLKLDDRLWIYSPSSDRTIQLSGHMLKQSVMGSDLSYEDMMEDRERLEIYKPTLISEDTHDDQPAYVIELNAIVEDVTYIKVKMWVHKTKYVPLREEMYAKSGTLLKTISYSNIKEIDGRQFPTKMNYKDELKSGDGTDFIINEIEFNADIPEYIFNKASLTR